MQNPPRESIFIEQDDLNWFKNVVMIFLLSKILGIGLNIINPVLGSLVNNGGTVVFGLGILLLARKNPKLMSGIRVGLLLVLTGVLTFGSSMISYLNPTPSLSTGTPQQQIALVFASLKPNFIYIAVLTTISAIVLLIASYYFTKWFNLGFGEYKPTKSFLYYGILSFIGSIISIIGEYLLIQEFSNMTLTSGTFTDAQLQAVFPSVFVSVIGAFFVFAGFIYLFIACVKIYYRVNDKLLGKTPFNQPGASYQNPYQQPYQPNNQQASQTANTQYGTINPNKLNQPAFDQSTSMNSATDTTTQAPSENIFCSYCGAQIQPGVKFCQSCGNKV